MCGAEGLRFTIGEGMIQPRNIPCRRFSIAEYSETPQSVCCQQHSWSSYFLPFLLLRLSCYCFKSIISASCKLENEALKLMKFGGEGGWVIKSDWDFNAWLEIVQIFSGWNEVANARTKINSFPSNSVYLYSACMERKFVPVSLHDNIDCVRKVRYLFD